MGREREGARFHVFSGLSETSRCAEKRPENSEQSEVLVELTQQSTESLL
jgi:hypothetical protein